MIEAFLLACRDVLAPRQARTLLLSLAISVAVFAAVWVGASWLLGSAHPFDIAWLDRSLALLGSLAVLVLSWLLFPAAVMLVQGFFLDAVIDRLEQAHYPGLGPSRGLRLGDVLWSSLSLGALMLIGNLLLLPFYFWPLLNLVLYYGLNGWLLGRQYFELVTLRRLDRAARRALWRRHRGRFLLAGVGIAVLFSLPLVDLAAPLLSAAFMLHLFAGLRRRAAW